MLEKFFMQLGMENFFASQELTFLRYNRTSVFGRKDIW